jgi:transaldolase
MYGDTAEIQWIINHKPPNVTTNPSLVSQAAHMNQYSNLVDKAIEYGVSKCRSTDPNNDYLTKLIVDKVLITFGEEISKIEPGDIFTEVDARLSYDIQAQVDSVKRLYSLYEEVKVPRERIFIKILATWEGIKAGQILENEGYRVLMTQVCTMAQAYCVADSGAHHLAFPLGRFNDSHIKYYGKTWTQVSDEPALKRIREIYNYYKKFDIKTKVQAAAVRYPEQIVECAGIDHMTINPPPWMEAEKSFIKMVRKFNPEDCKNMNIKRYYLDEKLFRKMHNDDEVGSDAVMLTYRTFCKDLDKLENLVRERLLKKNVKPKF